MITDQNARVVGVEYVIDAAGKKAVLVVETDLALDEIEIDFDRSAVDALCRDLARHRDENPYLHAIRLVRASLAAPKKAELTGRFGDQQFKIASD